MNSKFFPEVNQLLKIKGLRISSLTNEKILPKRLYLLFLIRRAQIPIAICVPACLALLPESELPEHRDCAISSFKIGLA